MIQLILVLGLVGFILYLIETYVPMAAPFKVVIRVLVAVLLILWLMRVLGVADIPLPRL